MKHTKYPDKDIVRVALTDARKEKNGELVEGRSGQRLGLTAKTSRRPVDDGWALTSRGITWIEQNKASIEKMVGAGQLKQHRQKILTQLKHIREHRLFMQYADSPERFAPMLGQIADILRCRVDAEPYVWEQRFHKIRQQAQATDQQDILNFIAKCVEAYAAQC